MGQLEQDDWDKDAEAEQEQATNLGMIPFFGTDMAAGHTAKARQLLGKKAEDIINDVNLPEFSDADYGQYSLAGEYNPDAAGYQTVSEDPRTRDLQMQALERLQDGMSAASQTGAAADKAAALSEGNQMANAREQAIRMQMERSGQGGSGMDAVLRAQGAQMGANRAAQGSLDANHQLALERLANEQGLIGAAGNVRGQDFNTARTNADIINQFGMFNTQAANEAKRMNLGNAQQIGNANVDMQNKSFDRKEGNKQTQFGNAMGKATARGNAVQGMSNSAGDAGRAQAVGSAEAGNSAKDLVAGFFGLGADDGSKKK
jgi:hypothetical protein